MLTKNRIQALHKTIKSQNERTDILKSKMKVMEIYITNVEKGVDNKEQHNYCLGLCIDDIAKDQNRIR